MIKNWLITGDTHGKVFDRLAKINSSLYAPAETALIILGDAGLNFYLNKTDQIKKSLVQNTGFTIYCVRGNHEERPENLGFKLVNDANVGNMVYVEEAFPNIRYFVDGGNYIINGHPILTIGGAYSIDKEYRLERAKITGSSFTGWFPDEQLTEQEMTAIAEGSKGKHFDFVFTHTCPLDWEPVDLFLRGVNQATVDKTMETWLNTLKDVIDWGVWCFGHYHADRLERPCVEQFFQDIELLEDVFNRWANPSEQLAETFMMDKSPYYGE